MRFPWSKKEVVSEPAEYLSPEEREEYVKELERDTKAWRAALGPSFGGRRGPYGPSLGGLRYVSGYRGAYKDFLEEFSEAVTRSEKIEVFNKYVRSMMARRWKREGAEDRLMQALIEHGLVESGEID